MTATNPNTTTFFFIFFLSFHILNLIIALLIKQRLCQLVFQKPDDVPHPHLRIDLVRVFNGLNFIYKLKRDTAYKN